MVGSTCSRLTSESSSLPSVARLANGEAVCSRLIRGVRSTMPSLSLPSTRTIRENVAVLLTYSFSRAPLEEVVKERFQGEFKQFHDTAFQLAQQQAERACLELALLLRYLDDEEQVSAAYLGYSQVDFGFVTKPDGSLEALTLREVTNKIIHARGFTWDTTKWNHPKLVCHPRDGQRWSMANVDITALSAVCGSLVG